MTPPNQVSDSRKIRRQGESGSAYLATLLVLVVLTILGLSLAVITQTEVLIGGSEKQATRQLFAANSGVAIATGLEIVTSASQAHQLRLAERTEDILGQDAVIADDICTSPFFQLSSGVCNLCMLNQDAEYAAVQYGVTATALRRGDATLGARKSLGAVIALEPWKKSITGGQMASEERFQEPDPADIDFASVDPCEGLYLKI
jgi:hypothetical protein